LFSEKISLAKDYAEREVRESRKAKVRFFIINGQSADQVFPFPFCFLFFFFLFSFSFFSFLSFLDQQEILFLLDDSWN